MRFRHTSTLIASAALALAVVAGLAAQDVRTDPGPLEKRAKAITPEQMELSRVRARETRGCGWRMKY